MRISKKQIAKFQEKQARRDAGHIANNLEMAGMVKDRKTGEWYDPLQRLKERMLQNLDILHRLAKR